MNFAPLKTPLKSAATTISPKSLSARSFWLTSLFILVVGTVGWDTHRRISSNLASVPVPMLKALPHIQVAIQATQLPQITAQALKEKIDRRDTDYVLVDVRSPREFQASRIPSAISIPLFVFQEKDSVQHVKALLNGRKLIIYGTSGYRSTKALLKLNQQGLSGMKLVGGMAEWQTAIESQASVE
jgi:rhodanese-related sulfurtransferase